MRSGCIRRYASILVALAFAAGGSARAQEPPESGEPDPFLTSIQQELADMDREGPQPGGESGTDAGIGSGLIDSRVVLQAIMALAIVLTLLLVLFALLRKFGNRIPALAGNELGQVLGRLYLERGSALYFVRVGPHVLVVGVTASAISHVAVLPAEDLVGGISAPDSETEAGPFDPDRFLQHLRATSAAGTGSSGSAVSDSDVTRLRSDIQRLQQFLQEEARGRND
jgi:flagellar biogenesis protein FliO